MTKMLLHCCQSATALNPEFVKILGAKNKDLGFALQMLPARDTLNLQQRLKGPNGDGGVKKKGGIIINITTK